MRTMKFAAVATACAVAGVTGMSAQAVYITDFNKTTNDGVFTLSPTQAIDLGVPTADRVGYYRIREGNGTTFTAGDTFDLNSILNSTGSDASILGVFNGENPDLAYTGAFYEPLGTTTIGAPNSYFRGVMFAFNSSSGNIVFDGTSTFNGGQTQGPWVPVPEPTSLALLGFAGVGLMARRRA